MKYWLGINQAALRRWMKSEKQQKNQIDITDAAILSFIRDLSPDNPEVRKYMVGGRYLLTLSWILEQLPILDITKDWLSRKLHKLRDLGLIDLHRIVDRKKQYRLYGRLTEKYFREEDKANLELNRPRENNPMVENSHGSTDQNPAVYSPIDSKKENQEETAAALLEGAAGSPQSATEVPWESSPTIAENAIRCPKCKRNLADVCSAYVMCECGFEFGMTVARYIETQTLFEPEDSEEAPFPKAASS